MKESPNRARRNKPAGGFRKLSTFQVAAVWSAYRLGMLKKFSTVRTYLALLEFAERRDAEHRRRAQQRKSDREFPITRSQIIKEVAQLLNTPSHEMARKAIGNLERSGLVEFQSNNVVFMLDPERLPGDLNDAMGAMLRRIDPREQVQQRTIRFPRRMIRFLAGCPRSAMTATVFGHALRCLWTDGRQLKFEGSCSAAFVSDVFGIHVRTVRAARRELMESGWLGAVDADAWHVRRYGQRLRINSTWQPSPSVDNCETAKQVTGTESPRIGRSTGTNSPPAYSKPRTSSSTQKPEPADRRPLGAKGRLRNRNTGSLLNLKSSDLEDPQRLEQIRDECIRGGLINGGEADRLNLVAAACRARRVSTENACGMFRAIVERRCWSHISQVDEDMARSLLRSPPNDPTSLLNAIGLPASSDTLAKRATGVFDRNSRAQESPGDHDGSTVKVGRRSVA